MPSDVPTCKNNLFKWLSQVVDQLNQDTSRVLHCWEETQLLRAWERIVQIEASSRAKEIFPKLVTAQLVEDHAAAEDVAAAEPGLLFTETEDDEEWINWVNWAEVEAQTGGTSSS